VRGWREDPKIHPEIKRAESVQKIEQEIRRAKAEALGRAGERLEAALADLAGLDRRLDGWLVAAGPEVRREPGFVREMEARNRLRDEAAGLRQQLIIQREALGLVRHGLVEQWYPVPPRRPV
jgi:hypothetical protein